MAEINKLSAIDTLAAGDLVPVYDQSSGDARKAAMSVILQFVQDNLVFPAGFTSQSSSPSATGFSVQVTDGSDDIWLQLTPVAGYAAGTIVLPAVANVVDKQEVLVNCTQVVTTLTINKNGATALTGAPTTLAANAFFRLKYDAATSTWYRVG